MHFAKRRHLFFRSSVRPLTHHHLMKISWVLFRLFSPFVSGSFVPKVNSSFHVRLVELYMVADGVYTRICIF